MEQTTASLTPDARTPRTHSSSRVPSPRRMETDDSEKAGRVWAREADADAWAPCILTLDGGGIRGYSSLMILKELMHHIWLWETRLAEEEGELTMIDSVNSSQQQRGRVRASAAEPSEVTPSGEVTEYSLTLNDQDTADVVESQYGVDPDVKLSKVETPHQHVAQDQMTTNLTVRKALSEEELLPCHYFDFMYGTSTGGLIATILGRLRMSVTEGLELYRTVGDALFGQKRSNIPLRTKYHHEPLERAVRDIVASRCRIHPQCDGNDMHPWVGNAGDNIEDMEPFDVDEPRVCQSCCLTATNDEHISEAHLLRSYNHCYSENSPNWITPYNQGADMLPIWQVTRATTAAPFYFEMVKAVVDDVEMSFKDGGIRENNPSGAALSEFHALYEGKLDHPALMLSIGTGRPDQTQNGFAGATGPFGRLPFVNKFLEKRAVIQNLLIKYTEGEHQHLQMREHAHGEHTWYKRLNVSEGLQDMSLDDWVKGEWHGQANVPGGASLTRMEEATDKYLDRDFDAEIDSYAPPGVMLRQAAEKLVRQRRAREKLGRERWDVFVGRNLDSHVSSAEGAG